MIELTVKTLDSQNHAFSLEDDQITVRTFKEHIAESVAVPADSQRLIYCGRVLQDEKKLNDYDVNGKVIHLVQRAPPQPGQHGNDGGQHQGQNHGPGWQHTEGPILRLGPTPMHAMHLGTMSVSAEIMERHGVPMPQLSHNLSSSRLVVARYMLGRANGLINRLDDPNCPLNPPASENNQTPLAQEVQTQQGETERNETNETRTSNGTPSAVGAGLSATWTNNATAAEGNSDRSTETRATSDGNDGNQPGSQEQQESQTQNQGSTTNSDGQSNRRTDPQIARPPQMSELLQQLNEIHQRFRPYIERYYTIMQEDPVLTSGSGPDSLEATQRIVDGVSKTLHWLSHACHALSDIILDLRQPPPRSLQCRPVIIQESAILESDVPIQVQARINLHGPNVNNNNGNEEANQSANAQSESSEANTETTGQQQESENAGQQQTEQQGQTQSPFGAVFNLPNNVEVLMEVTPESNIEVLAAGEQPQTGENNNNNNNAGRMPEAAGVSIRTRPPYELMRNFMHLIAGHIVQSAVTATTIMARDPSTSVGGQQPVATSHDTGTTNAGQSTQARSNTGTHPTTATQTRSTSRPHVFHQQSHPVGIGMSINPAFDFDPFLPCNSHHFRRTSSVTPNTVTSMSQGTRSNRTATSETQTQAQTTTTTTRNTSTTASNATTGNTTSTNTVPPTTTASTGGSPSVGLLQQILRDTTGQSQASINISPELAESLETVLQMIRGGGIHAGLEGDRTYTVNTDFDVAENRGASTDLFRPGNERNFLTNLIDLVGGNITVEEWTRLKRGEWEPVANLRRRLQDFVQYSCPNTTVENRHEHASDLLLAQLRPHLRSAFGGGKKADSAHPRVDLCGTIESLIRQHMKDIMRVLYDNASDDAKFAQKTISIILRLRRQLCMVLQYCCRNYQGRLDALRSSFGTEILTVGPGIREVWMNEYSSFRLDVGELAKPPESEVIPLLVYKQAPSEPAVAPPASAPQPTQQATSEVEPMETEPAEERTTTETPLAEDSEEVPETFLGRGVLPPEWISIIAGDGVRQRRQLQVQGMAIDGVTPFSDAYLGTLPTKRRKLIEKHKPRLLVSPTPSHSAITASMECLVREGVEQAGVEEVEGAAVAVAADPAVRRAFGQAIRDCLNPCRFGTPDFPNPLRFPNATKYFADPERSSKQ